MASFTEFQDPNEFLFKMSQSVSPQKHSEQSFTQGSHIYFLKASPNSDLKHTQCCKLMSDILKTPLNLGARHCIFVRPTTYFDNSDHDPDVDAQP